MCSVSSIKLVNILEASFYLFLIQLAQNDCCDDLLEEFGLCDDVKSNGNHVISLHAKFYVIMIFGQYVFALLIPKSSLNMGIIGSKNRSLALGKGKTCSDVGPSWHSCFLLLAKSSGWNKGKWKTYHVVC